MKIKNLICATCGCSAPAYKQWWNRDTGYGVCARCYIESVQRHGEEVSIDYFGRPGIHHSIVKGQLEVVNVDADIAAIVEELRKINLEELRDHQIATKVAIVGDK